MTIQRKKFLSGILQKAETRKQVLLTCSFIAYSVVVAFYMDMFLESFYFALLRDSGLDW